MYKYNEGIIIIPGILKPPSLAEWMKIFQLFSSFDENQLTKYIYTVNPNQNKIIKKENADLPQGFQDISKCSRDLVF